VVGIVHEHVEEGHRRVDGRQSGEKRGEDVPVDARRKPREPGPGRRAGGRLLRRRRPRLPPAGPPSAPSLGPREALPLRPQEEESAEDGQQRVGEPHRERRGHPAVLRPVLTGVEEEVVREDDRERDREAAPAAPAAVRDPEGEPHEREHETGDGDRELLVDLDLEQAVPLRRERRAPHVAPELGQRLEPHALLDPLSGAGTVAALVDEDAQPVAVVETVHAPVEPLRGVLDRPGQIEPEPPPVEAESPLSRDDHRFTVRVGTVVEENPPPPGGAGEVPVDEHHPVPLRARLGEDPRPDHLERGRREETALHPFQAVVGGRVAPHAEERDQDREPGTRETDGKEKPRARHSRGPERDDLRIARQPPDPDEDPEQEGHRNREDEHLRQGQEEQLAHDGRRHSAPHDHLGELDEGTQEEKERVGGQPEAERRNDFPQHVARDQTHGCRQSRRDARCAIGDRDEARKGGPRAGRSRLTASDKIYYVK
jgi:hypothetical protein